jgi:hypothetical protein
MRYRVYRSVNHKSLHVLHYEDRFHELPERIRHRGPWQELASGEVQGLRPEYQAALAERGHLVIEQSAGTLSVEM